MSTNTEILDLFKYDPVVDANNTFNITEAMNNNWDKLDNKISITEHDSNATYKSGIWVKDGDKLYKSLQDNNTNHATSETDYWEEVVFDDDNKLNTDADNLTQTGKETITSLGFPSDKYEDLTLLASGSTGYAPAPADGYVVLQTDHSGTTASIITVGPTANRGVGNTGTCVTGVVLKVTAKIRKGQEFTVNYNNATNLILYFVYAEGNKND